MYNLGNDLKRNSKYDSLSNCSTYNTKSSNPRKYKKRHLEYWCKCSLCHLSDEYR